MWCPTCRQVTVCKGISPSFIGESGRRWHRTDHNDINWFRRGRECQTCLTAFVTAEIDEQFIDELVELRDSLAELKKNAEAYTKESRAASASLEKLTNALSVLRALKMYETA